MCVQVCAEPCVCVHAQVHTVGAQVLMCVSGMCGMRGWQPEPAPPAPATPGSNPCSSSSQATPWTQMQVVRGRGSRATDGALHPTPTAPRQVGLIPPGPRQATLNKLSLGPAFQPGTRTPGPSPQGSRLCAPSQPFPRSDSDGSLSCIHVSLSVTPAGKKP